MIKLLIRLLKNSFFHAKCVFRWRRITRLSMLRWSRSTKKNLLTLSAKFRILNYNFKTLFYSLTCSNRSLLNKQLQFNSKPSKTKPKIYHSMNNYEKPKENSKQPKDSPPPKTRPKTLASNNPITTSTPTTQNYTNPDQ